MKSLWRRGTARVRDVQSDLLPGRRLAYTTVMTVLDRLFRKGVVGRTKESRAHLYEPSISEAASRAEAVTGLLDAYFGGSSGELRAFLDRSKRPESATVRESPRLPIDESLL
jgi:predicted transcriptional regulator